MVSLSSKENLKNMVENYGFSSYLFTQLNSEQLDLLYETSFDFREYLDMLFSGKIYDPESLEILTLKYERMKQQPNVYELKVTNSEIQKYIRLDDIDILQAGLLSFANEQVSKIKSVELTKGDVVYLFGDIFESYYIYSFTVGLENVYFRLNSQDERSKNHLELIEPIKYMDILGSTPVNYWNHLEIPKLSFEFDLQLVYEKIRWGKSKIQNQEYLIGEFINQKKKVYLIVPIPKFKTSAEKIAVSLQISTKKVFLTSDPRGIIPGNPDIFFADLNLDLISLPIPSEQFDDDESE